MSRYNRAFHIHMQKARLFTYFSSICKDRQIKQPVIQLKFYHSSDSDFAKELFKISFKI